MKFTIAALAGLASAINAASLPASFSLVAPGGKTVQTDGTNLYINANVTEQQVAVLKSQGEQGYVIYTAEGSVPTAFQNVYIVPDEVSPVGLTVPHSGATPEGAIITNFGVNDDGYFTNDGKAWFAIDGPDDGSLKKIYWYGAHNGEYGSLPLWVKEFK
ncbi:hypothetical protein N7468_008837 [Penicillium chermesinum]|uniref:Uncharacterized protein n=1 Tax=Penicillium chermesinum TaxID=63820 RepID=A0A9W9TEF6_9EURO|nr:uncharacterized protein N7468_008837 [Penicillium chermesinum]KAJ5219633.1 hypothetical protein N7468_008837 [Penicillium chermesinum]